MDRQQPPSKRRRLEQAGVNADRRFAVQPRQQVQPCPGTLRIGVHNSNGVSITATASIDGGAPFQVQGFWGGRRAPGWYSVQVQAAGYFTQVRRWQVFSRQQTNADYVLIQMGHLEVTVQDTGGQAIPGANVSATGQGPARQTNQYGIVQLNNLTPKSYRVDVDADGFIGMYGNYLVTGGQTAQALFQLRRPGHLVVTVQDATGQAIVGANVVATAPVAGRQSKTTERHSGVARFDDQTLEDYKVEVDADGFVGMNGTYTVTEGQTTQALFQLRPPCRLVVKVLDRETNQSIDSGDLTLKSDFMSDQAAAFQQGEHVFDPWPAGKYSITASVQDYLDATIEVEAPAGEETSCELKLPGARIFIVGEGTGFGYAIGLARKHPKRRVIASQYDVTQPPGGLPANLTIYRDAVDPNGSFDALDSQYWGRVNTAHGPFYAVIFNNPHAGNGLPKAQVYGAKTGIHPYHYQSLFSTAGHQGYLTDYSLSPPQDEDVSQLFERRCGKCRKEPDATVVTPLPGGAIDCTQASCGARDWVAVYQVQGRRGLCGTCRRPVGDGASQCSACKAYCLYYFPRRATGGLNPYLLRCYIRFGKGLLQVGGTLNINGPTWVSYYASKTDWLSGNVQQGFPKAATQRFKDGELYVAYQPNLTHATPHLSWGPSTTSEARPESMTRYYWTKTR